MVNDAVLSAEQMLARSAANVASGRTAKNQSAVQKLLAQRDTPLPEDTVELSPVQKILQAQAAEEAAQENYFESDEYLQLKIGQLQSQLSLYSNLPGLDPTGAVLSGLEAEIKDMFEKQQAKLNKTLKEGEEKQARLEEQQRLQALELPSPEQLLARLRGETKPPPLSKEVKALLDNAAKGANVNTSA